MTENLISLARSGFVLYVNSCFISNYFVVSPLQKVWLAATVDKGLNRAAILNADIVKLVKLISKGMESKDEKEHHEPLTVRLSSVLYFGLVRIYSKKTRNK